METSPLEEIDYSKDFDSLSKEEKYRRSNLLLSKFREEFGQMILTDPMSRAVFEYLRRGADPYKIIFDLLTDRQNILKERIIV